MKISKQNSGITLIALIITIIVLLILATISIVALTGENGFITKAIEAREEIKINAYKEEIELTRKEIRLQKENYEPPTLQEMKTALDQKTWIKQETEIINDEEDNGIEKLKLITKEEYIFYITGTETEYRGKGLNNTEPTIKVRTEDMSNLKRKTQKSLIDLFDITWGRNGIGTIQYEVIGNQLFNNKSFYSNALTNLENLELGTYQIKCTITSPNNITKSATKENVTIKELANTTLVNLNGTSIEGYAIYSEYDLAYFRDLVNRETKAINGKLMNPINLGNVCSEEIGSWIPIGNQTNPFKGTFQGEKPYKIDSLYINTTNDEQGLFGTIKNAEITQVVIGEQSKIIGNSNVGGIVGYGIDSTITNSGNNGNITGKGKSAIGGIIGNNKNVKVIGVYNKGEIKGEEGSSTYGIGGICGASDKESTSEKVLIAYSYNTGKVEGAFYVGGILGTGNNYIKVNNCYNKGEVIGKMKNANGHSFIGGIAGRINMYGEINYSYNLATVSNEDITGGWNTGGIVGTLNAYNGTQIVEEGSSKVKYSYNSGNVTSKGNRVGGICGENNQYCHIENSHIANTVIVEINSSKALSDIGKSTEFLGKIIGENKSDSNNISDIGVLSAMPTVYKVVDGLNDGESQYWSKSNVNEPSLLWEEENNKT